MICSSCDVKYGTSDHFLQHHSSKNIYQIFFIKAFWSCNFQSQMSQFENQGLDITFLVSVISLCFDILSSSVTVFPQVAKVFIWWLYLFDFQSRKTVSVLLHIFALGCLPVDIILVETIILKENIHDLHCRQHNFLFLLTEYSFSIFFYWGKM